MDNNKAILMIKDILCPMCLEVYEAQAVKAKSIKGKGQERQFKDIYKMHHMYLEEEKRIRTSLSSEKQDAYWGYVISMQDMLQGRMKIAQIIEGRSRIDCAEEEILYDIFMSAIWIAAQTYNPSKGKFSTYVYRRWIWAEIEFWRVLKRSVRQKKYTNDPDNTRTRQDLLKDETLSSAEQVISEEVDDWMAATPFWEIMIADIYQKDGQEYEWLCPFCRKEIRDAYTQVYPQKYKYTEFKKNTYLNVFGRYDLWANIESNLTNSITLDG